MAPSSHHHHEFVHQVRVLAWKNFNIKLRNWVALCLEVLTPIVIVIALGGVKAGIGATTYTSVSPMNYRHGSTLEALYTQNAPLCTDMNLVYMCALSVSCANFKNYAAGAWLSTRCTERKIAVVSDVAGNDGATAAAMGFMAYAYSVSPTANKKQTFQFFPSEAAFESVVTDPMYTVRGDLYSSAIVFHSGFPDWDYTVRVNRSYTYRRLSRTSPVSAKPMTIGLATPNTAPGGGGGLTGLPPRSLPFLEAYQELGVYTLMDTVHSYAAVQTACKTATGASCTTAAQLAKYSIMTGGLAHFPSPQADVSSFWAGIGFVFALLMIIALLLPLANVIKALVEEKETRMREMMYMMGLRSDALWLTWFAHFMCLFVPLAVLLAGTSRQLFAYSDVTLVFLYFVVFFIRYLRTPWRRCAWLR